jgi:hypothetical protein
VARTRDRGNRGITRPVRWLAALASGAALAVAGPAAAQGPPPDPPPGEFEVWLDGQRDPLGRPCDRRGAELDVDRTLIACGGAGLWVVQRTATGAFTLAAVQDLGGDVVGLFKRDGRVWAVVARLEARPVLRGSGPADTAGAAGSTGGVQTDDAAAKAGNLAGGAASKPTTTPPPESELPTREGRVTEVGIGEVVVNLGREDGLKHGDRVEFAVTVTETVGGQDAADREVVAVGVVRTMAANYCRVDLGMNEKVPLNATARVVDRGKTESRMAPPRAAGLWELMLKLRPFVALDGLGGGLLMQSAVRYRFESHFALSAEVHPFGFADGQGPDNATLVPAAAFVSAAYDAEVFEIGLGVGIQTVHDTDFGLASGTGTLLTQRLRLGSRDGLMMDLRNDVVLFHSQFDFSGFVGSAMIPVGSRAWLLFEGGGGSAGYAYGELGLRSLLRGNGQHGSVFLSVTLGGQAVFETRQKTCFQDEFSFPCVDEQLYAGPMLGIGAEYRL